MENSLDESLKTVNEKQIKSDFLRGLENAESSILPSGDNGTSTNGVKLRINIPNLVTKLLLDVKNSIEAKIITKDMDEDVKEFVRGLLKTTPKEVELYKMLLDEVGTEFTPEEYKEFLNKWLLNPSIATIILIVEMETEKFVTARNSIKGFLKNKESTKEVA